MLNLLFLLLMSLFMIHNQRSGLKPSMCKVKDGSCHTWHPHGDVLVIPSSTEWKMSTVQILPWCHIHVALDRKHSSNSSGQRSSRCKVEGTGGGATGQPEGSCLGACLFYKQWEQISIGARLPQPYGEDVLWVRGLLTNHCVHCWRHTVTGIISGHHQ